MLPIVLCSSTLRCRASEYKRDRTADALRHDRHVVALLPQARKCCGISKLPSYELRPDISSFCDTIAVDPLLSVDASLGRSFCAGDAAVTDPSVGTSGGRPPLD